MNWIKENRTQECHEGDIKVMNGPEIGEQDFGIRIDVQGRIMDEVSNF